MAASESDNSAPPFALHAVRSVFSAPAAQHGHGKPCRFAWRIPVCPLGFPIARQEEAAHGFFGWVPSPRHCVTERCRTVHITDCPHSLSRNIVMSPRPAGAARRLRLEQLESRLALATLYVSTSGNDAANGSEATPWRTLQHAANRCRRATPSLSGRATTSAFTSLKTAPRPIASRSAAKPARTSRSATRLRPTASTSKGPTTSRSRASRSTTCRGPASAACSTTT